MRTNLLLTTSLFLLFLVGCYPPPPARFQTDCGMEFVGTYPEGGPLFGWNKEALQYAEDRTLEVFSAEVTDPRFNRPEICRAMGGVKLFVHPDESFPRAIYNDRLDPPPLSSLTQKDLDHQVAGLSDCMMGYMVLSDIGMIYKTAFAHEVAHFVQKCSSLPPNDPGVDDDHRNWHRDGITDAVEKVQGR